MNHPLSNYQTRPEALTDMAAHAHGPTGPTTGAGAAPAPLAGPPHPLAPQAAGHGDTPFLSAAPDEKDREDLAAAAQFPLLPPGARQLLYTPEQAATLLAVRASWLRRAAGEGTIACTYLGKHLRFSDDDLQAIITGGARGWRPDPTE
jgi:excisionase family DNA binding protein